MAQLYRFKQKWIMLVCIGTVLLAALIYKLCSAYGNNLKPGTYVEDAQLLNIEMDGFNGPWYVVNSSVEMYLFAAYYDDRASLWSHPVIRVIGISESELEKMGLYCYIWFDSTNSPLVVNADVLRSGEGDFRHGKYFREHIYTCTLQNNEVPKTISIEQGLKGSVAPSTTTYIPVQVPAKPHFKHDFMNWVKATYGKIDPYAVIEWMELQKIWGVDKVTIYNSSIEGKSLDVFLHYQKEGFVDFRQSPQFIPNTGDVSKRLMASPTICDCIYRNMHTYKNIIVTDLDELIVPRTTINYKSMIAEINKQQPNEHEARSYVFRNAHFFTDKYMSEDRNMPKELVTLRHRVRLPPNGKDDSVKSIVDPQACVVMHNHKCWYRAKGYDTHGHTVIVNTNLAMNQHYKKCHFDKFFQEPGRCVRMMKSRVKDDTMLRFKDDLIKNVAKKLKALGLNE